MIFQVIPRPVDARRSASSRLGQLFPRLRRAAFELGAQARGVDGHAALGKSMRHLGNDGRIAVACLRYAADEDTFTRGRVTELVADRLVVLDDQGRLLFETEKPVSVPNGIAMDSRGDIYVAHVTRYHRVNEESSLEAARTATGSSIPKFRRLD